MNVALIHGPNLNWLGRREPHVYGTLTLGDIEESLRAAAQAAGHTLETHQDASEGGLVGILQAVARSSHAVIFNPGGFSHTSVALRDAVAAMPIPVVEVHLSNIHAREDFRRRTLTGSAATACISGLGLDGYLAALNHLISGAQGASGR